MRQADFSLEIVALLGRCGEKREASTYARLDCGNGGTLQIVRYESGEIVVRFHSETEAARIVYYRTAGGTVVADTDVSGADWKRAVWGVLDMADTYGVIVREVAA
jgi:hypothetical protein